MEMALENSSCESSRLNYIISIHLVRNNESEGLISEIETPSKFEFEDRIEIDEGRKCPLIEIISSGGGPSLTLC